MTSISRCPCLCPLMLQARRQSGHPSTRMAPFVIFPLHDIRRRLTKESRMRPLIRKATAEDTARIGTITRAAYAKYVPRIGREPPPMVADFAAAVARSEEHTSELQSRENLVCRLLLE